MGYLLIGKFISPSRPEGREHLARARCSRACARWLRHGRWPSGPGTPARKHPRRTTSRSASWSGGRPTRWSSLGAVAALGRRAISMRESRRTHAIMRHEFKQDSRLSKAVGCAHQPDGREWQCSSRAGKRDPRSVNRGCASHLPLTRRAGCRRADSPWREVRPR